ncbi:hypothetical protein HDK64DRAFT_320012 [Phyllosticta capitalensis]
MPPWRFFLLLGPHLVFSKVCTHLPLSSPWSNRCTPKDCCGVPFVGAAGRTPHQMSTAALRLPPRCQRSSCKLGVLFDRCGYFYSEECDCTRTKLRQTSRLLPCHLFPKTTPPSAWTNAEALRLPLYYSSHLLVHKVPQYPGSVLISVMAQETTTSPSTSSATSSSTTSSATSSSGSSASSTHIIIIIVTAVIFGTLALILMSVFGFVLKKRGLRRTKSNDFEKNSPYQNTSAHKKAMSTANLPSFAWERTTQAPAELAIAAQNEQSKNPRARRVTVSQEVNTNPAQGSTQSFTPLLRDVDDSNVTTTVMSDPHRRAQSAGDNLIAYITYNDPGFTSNHQLRSTGLVPLQIERQPSPPSPLVSKHGSLHSITTSSGTATTPSSGPNSSTDSRPSTRSASMSQKVMTSSLPPPLPPSICIQPHTPIVERSDEQQNKKPEDEVKAYEPFRGSSTALPTPPITPSFSSRPSSSCSVNTTAASPPTPPTTGSTNMHSLSHLPPSLRPGNAGNRSTVALPVPAAVHDGSNSTASKRLSTASTVSTRRRTLSNPLHIQLHLNPLQQLAPAPATASHSHHHHHHSRSRSTGRDSTASNGSGNSSSSSSSASTPSVNSNGSSSSQPNKSKHGKRLSSFDAHRLSEQEAAREWAQARARSRSASRSSVVPSGVERYYAGGSNASVTDLPATTEAETTANGSSAATDKKENQSEADKQQQQDPSRLSAEGHGQGERKTRRRTISGDWLRRGRDRGAGASIGALIGTALC